MRSSNRTAASSSPSWVTESGSLRALHRQGRQQPLLRHDRISPPKRRASLPPSRSVNAVPRPVATLAARCSPRNGQPLSRFGTRRSELERGYAGSDSVPGLAPALLLGGGCLSPALQGATASRPLTPKGYTPPCGQPSNRRSLKRHSPPLPERRPSSCGVVQVHTTADTAGLRAPGPASLWLANSIEDPICPQDGDESSSYLRLGSAPISGSALARPASATIGTMTMGMRSVTGGRRSLGCWQGRSL